MGRRTASAGLNWATSYAHPTLRWRQQVLGLLVRQATAEGDDQKWRERVSQLTSDLAARDEALRKEHLEREREAEASRQRQQHRAALDVSAAASNSQKVQAAIHALAELGGKK